MHITITGNLGSGKSTICKLLNEQYQFEVYSTGKVQREIAREMNMTTLELNQLMCSDHKYDTMIDDATARISRENREKDIIFDSRLAWHFVEHSFKVFVTVSLDVAANRVMQDQRGAEEKYSSFDEAKKLLAERAATEKRRYKDIYDLDYLDFSNYNLVIDSTYCSADKIAEMIIVEAKAFEENPYTGTKMLMTPERLLQLEEMKEDDQTRLQELITSMKDGSDMIDTTVIVRNSEDGYQVEEGLDLVKAAFLAKIPYVPVKVVKSIED
ncbi:MAG: hypothetical protein K0S47_655 [Herbinix sp.]|jgi:cytidylate kinase|nr:hypothetical protein [Herbinix sp.]